MSLAWWHNGDADNDFNNADNWETTEGGGTPFGGVPGSGDTCNFSATASNDNCNLSADIDVAHIYTRLLNTGGTDNYTGIIDFAANDVVVGNIKVTHLNFGDNTCDINGDYAGFGNINGEGCDVDCAGDYDDTYATYQRGLGSKLTLSGDGKSFKGGNYAGYTDFIIPVGVEIEKSGLYCGVFGAGCEIAGKFIITPLAGYDITFASFSFASYAELVLTGEIAGTGTLGWQCYFEFPTTGTITCPIEYGYNIHNVPARVWGGTIFLGTWTSFDMEITFKAGTHDCQKISNKNSESIGLREIIFNDAAIVELHNGGIDMSNMAGHAYELTMGTAQFKVHSGGIDLSHVDTVSGTPTWKIQGTTAQNIDFNGLDVGTIVNENATGVVTFSDGFIADLECTTPDASMKFQATKDFTGDFTLTGSSGHKIVMRSTTDGSAWNLIGDTVADHVDVKDSNSDRAVTQTNCTDSGGNTNWFVTAPVANFSGTPTSGVAPLTVAFTDSSTNTPTSWLWDFGDLGSSASQNPSHVYAAAGTYDVKLTATNAGGSDDETKVGYITATAVPVSGDSDLNANTLQAGGFLA